MTLTNFEALETIVQTGTDCRAPHRSRYRAVAQCPDGIEYRLVSNWPRTRWFLSARRGDMRFGVTRGTSSKTVAASWLQLFAPDALRDTIAGYQI